MNKEEKKAIEDMNSFANGIDMSCVTARQLQIILNLIEKLQKENEELLEVKVSASAHNRILELEKENEELKQEMEKRKWVHIKENGEVEPLFYISKDKIREKIKELEEEKKYYYSQYKIEELNDKIQVLQELIEEREEK